MLQLIVAGLLAAGRTYATDSTLFGDYYNKTEWLWQTSIVVGDWLYVDGGEFYNQADLSSPDVTFYSLSSTLRVDLSQPWTNATVVGGWWDHNSSQNTRRPNLFYNTDDNHVYRWGGWDYLDSNEPSLIMSFEAFDNGSVTWIEAAAFQTNGLGADSYAPFGAAGVSTDSSFYALGGDNTTYGLAVQGLVEYDFSSGQWTNSSSTEATSSGYLVQSQGTYVSNFGKSGFLMYVGGDLPLNQTYYYEGGSQLADMSDIILYDIDSKTWYHQKATGDIPLPRSEFCAVGAASQDKSSFEMFIYGGSTNTTWDWNNADSDSFLSLYSLSLPGFVWFKSNQTTPVRRSNHYCQIIGATAANGNSQMLSIGGRQPSSLEQFGAAPDPWVNGLGVFDMNAFSWAEYYDSGLGPYVQPQVMKDYYNNDYKKPDFSNDVLAKAFAFTPPPKPSSTTSAASSATSSGGSGSGSGGSGSGGGGGSHTGAIVGGVVGGVGGLALIALIVFLVMRSKRKARTRANETSSHEKGTEHEKGPIHEAPPYHDGFYGQKPVEKDASSPTAELQGQNQFNQPGATVKRKPVAGTRTGDGDGLVELPGS